MKYVIAVAAWWLLMLAASLPPQPAEFRPWDKLFRADLGHFVPNQRLESVEIGELGYKTWVRSLQHPHATIFTTDRFGWRNDGGVDDPKVVLIADSFMMGSGLSDDDTPAQVMSRLLGQSVVAYGATPAKYLSEPRFKQTPPPVVVYAPVSRAIRPRSLTYGERPKPDPTPFDGFIEASRAARSWVNRLNADNRLGREMKFAYQGLRYAVFGHERAVRTPGGELALVISLDQQGLTAPIEERGAKQTVEMVAKLAEVLAARRTRLVFAPIPESGTIYPEIFPEPERARIVRPSFLDFVIAQTRTRGVEVVDLRGVFSANRDPYLYRLDDTHWTPRGAELASRAISEVVARLMATKTPTSVPEDRPEGALLDGVDSGESSPDVEPNTLRPARSPEHSAPSRPSTSKPARSSP